MFFFSLFFNAILNIVKINLCSKFNVWVSLHTAILQGLYKKFRESGYRAVAMHFPPVFVTWSRRG